MTPITIGYWDTKGGAEYPKWVASYLGVPFIEKIHNQDWIEKGEKFSLGLDFPNLPYLIDGDFKMCESQAMAYYFAAKANNTEILGGDLFGQAKVRQILDVACDVNSAFQKALWSPQNTDIVSNIKKVVSEGAFPEKIELLSRYLGDRKYFVDDKPTLADLFIADVNQILSLLIRSSGNECPFRKHDNLTNHLRMVRGLPGIAEWIEKDKKLLIPDGVFPFPILDS